MKSSLSGLLLFSLLLSGITSGAEITVEVSSSLSPRAALDRVRDLRKNGEFGHATIVFPPGTPYRVRLRIRSNEPSAAFAAGAGYWQTSTTNLKVTDEWLEVVAAWQPWPIPFEKIGIRPE